MATRKRPKGVSEDLWARVYATGKLDVFDAEVVDLQAKGFSPDDSVKLALAKLYPPASGDAFPNDPTEDPRDGGGLPLAGSEPLNIDETRQAREIYPDDFKGKPKVSMLKVVEWVLNHIDHVSVSKDHCPSAAAWSMLNQCKDDKAYRREFYKSYVPKMMPTNQQMDVANRQRDDGRELDNQLSDLMRDFEEQPETYVPVMPDELRQDNGAQN